MTNEQIPQASVELVPSQEGEAFMPVLAIEHAKQRYNALVAFSREVMVAEKDYGIIPGTQKPTLLKAGAEKLTTFFGLTIEDPEILTQVEDWTGDRHGGEPFFYYQIRQRVSRSGKLIASQVASTNSWEFKYRYRWVKAAEIPPGLDKSKLPTKDGSVTELAFAIEQGATAGPFGKPAEYWQRFRDAIANGTAIRTKRDTRKGPMDAWQIGEPYYRVPNDRIFDQVNTLIKMCEKRALVAAVLLATNASEFYTQDLEDLDLIDTGSVSPLPQPHAAPQPAPHNAGAKMDDFMGKPVGVKHHHGKIEETTPPDLSHGVPPDAAAEQEGVPPPVAQPKGTVSEISGALAAANGKTADTLAARDGVKPIEDKPADPKQAEFRDSVAAKQAEALEKGPPNDDAPKPADERREVAAADGLADWQTAVAALSSLDSCKEFHSKVMPTVPADIRAKVLVMVLKRELELETSIVNCTKIGNRCPELKDLSKSHEQRIRDARKKNQQ